jgi:hypothetical protein
VGNLQRQTPALLDAVKSASSLKRVWQVFNDTQGFGRFLAYELSIDVNYSRLIDFSENDWVNAGPGCKRGILWIWGARDSSKRWEDYIAFLQARQETFISRADRLAEWHEVWPGYPMTLRGVEHSLCEFQKYARVRYHTNPDGTPSRSATRKYVLATA